MNRKLMMPRLAGEMRSIIGKSSIIRSSASAFVIAVVIRFDNVFVPSACNVIHNFTPRAGRVISMPTSHVFHLSPVDSTSRKYSGFVS